MTPVGPVRGRLPGGLDPEGLLDANDEVFGGLRSALGPDDRLQLPGELRAVQAAPAFDEVTGELVSAVRVELPVQIVLDLSQNFVAANP